MKKLMTYEEHTGATSKPKDDNHTPVEYVAYEKDHNSYKNEVEKKKRKKKGEVGKVDVVPNRMKDEISFQSRS